MGSDRGDGVYHAHLENHGHKTCESLLHPLPPQCIPEDTRVGLHRNVLRLDDHQHHVRAALACLRLGLRHCFELDPDSVDRFIGDMGVEDS